TVQRVHRHDDDELKEDDDDDDMNHRPFTLNDGDELSDDEQLDDNEHDTNSYQHIHDNFKVDNERVWLIICKKRKETIGFIY
ncbi:unnamed protein product, partial [Rotaria sp. Silwood1]